MKIVVFAKRGRIRRRRQWYVRLVAANGEILATTEGHHNHLDAIAVAHLIAEGTDRIEDA